MKKISIFTTLVITLLLSGCSNEELFDKQSIDQQDTGYIESNTVTIVATMPGESLENAKTRIALDQIGMNVVLTWEEGDNLHLCIVYDDPMGVTRQVREVVEVAISPDDARSASFSFPLPEDITDVFHIYGIYGGNGLSTVEGEEHWAILPTSSQYLGSSLKDLQDSEAVMLTFEKEIDLTDPELDLNVGFEHLGSLFSIQVNNNSANDWEGVKKVELRSTSTTTIGAHVNTGSGRYNIITGEFDDTESLTSLPFELPTATIIEAGKSVEFWGWYPPVSSVNWPAMTLLVTDANNVSWEIDASESKPARTSPTEAGKTFYFATYFDGTNLSFEDSQTDIIFVRPNASGNGTSWSGAMGDIQAAINKATSGKEVWIQGGTYKLSSPIVAKANVNVYGSFAGNETNIGDRALLTGGNPWDFVSPTVLDGQNQTRVLENRVASIIDGFTIINGNGASSSANGRAGGIDLGHVNAVIQNCIIRDNSSTTNGGGIHVFPSGTIRRCLVEDNSTTTGTALGGGIYANTSGETRVEECVIRGNFASQGGGIRAQGTGKNIISKSKIYNNTSSDAGGAIQLTTTNFELINCLIYNNESANKGAATVLAGGRTINNSFANNFGNIYFNSTANSYEFINNIVFGNEITNADDEPVSTVISGGVNNTNMEFYNNATGMTQTQIDGNQWQNEGNLFLSDIQNNAPHFRGSSSFVGAAKNEDQKAELEQVDLRILSTSPCFDSGRIVADITDDIMGTSRPRGAAYDMGAYELVP